MSNLKLIINTASTYKGGGVQAASSFIEECKKYDEHEYHIIRGEMLSGLIDRDAFPDNFSFYDIGYRPATRIFSFKSRDDFFKKLEARIKPDVVFTTSGPAYWRPTAPHLVGYNLPHYIYQDSPFFNQIPFKTKVKWRLKGRALKFFFKREAEAYVVQTNDVNKRLQKWLRSEEVYTVSNTYNHHYTNCVKAVNKLPEKETDEFRFLTLSAWYTHKNLKIIPKVIEALPQEFKKKIRFVLTLPPATFEKYFTSKVKDFITNVGPVKPAEGPALYNECDAL
ncbi:MAG TPA: glycosyltransferase, partial [Bacteroidales bacterium]|nr:glycosyltransferase [Bacteroidales bacterium]